MENVFENLEVFNHLYDKDIEKYIYEKGWLEYAVDLVAQRLSPLDMLLYKPYDLEAAKLNWGE